MAASLNIANLTLPSEIADKAYSKAQTGSTILALTTSGPQKFGEVDFAVLTADPRAQVVPESGAKAGGNASLKTVRAKRVKLQVSQRFSQELKWADEDHQIGALEVLGEKLSVALARAVDLITYHAIDPHSGTVLNGYTPLVSAAGTKIANPAKLDVGIDDAVGALIGTGFMPTGIAFDPTYSYGLSVMRKTDGSKLYPELGYGVNASAFNGIAASSSTTVSGRPEISADSGARAIVGDFNLIKWGVQKSIPVRLLEHGDPDNSGKDLQGHNELLLRAETAIYLGVLDTGGFSVVTQKP